MNFAIFSDSFGLIMKKSSMVSFYFFLLCKGYTVILIVLKSDKFLQQNYFNGHISNFWSEFLLDSRNTLRLKSC